MKPYKVPFTLIIPTAGEGKRLNFSGPKTLYPVLGKPILSWIVESFPFEPKQIVIVVNPKNETQVKNYISENNYLKNFEVTFAYQPFPKGNMDAVHQGVLASSNDINICIWGDQIGVTSSLISSAMDNFINGSNVCLTLPLIYRENPYVYFDLGKQGNIEGFFETSRGAGQIFSGLSDTGLFVFDRNLVLEYFKLKDAIDSDIELDNQDLNFLGCFKDMQDLGFKISKYFVYDLRCTHAINSKLDEANFLNFLEMSQKG